MASQVPFSMASTTSGTVATEGVLLAEDGGAGEVGELRGAGVGAVLLDDDDDLVVDVGVGEVRGLGALRGDGHAGADDVDGAVVEGVDERAKVHLHRDGLHAQLLGDALGNLHVVAVGESALDVLDGDGGVGFLGRLPVVGGIGCLHANAQGHAVAEGRGGGVGAGLVSGIIGVVRGGLLRGGTAAGKDHHASHARHEARKLEEVAARDSVRYVHVRGGLHGGSFPCFE